MYDLEYQIDRLARTTDPATAAVLRNQVEALLGRSERALNVLLHGPDAPLPNPPPTAVTGPAATTEMDAVEPAAGGASR
jgi:hypothetical protein